jgi:hypothetical protein
MASHRTFIKNGLPSRSNRSFDTKAREMTVSYLNDKLETELEVRRIKSP